MVPVLMARLGCKVSDDTPFGNDPILLNFIAAVFGSLVGQTPCRRCTGLTQENRTVRFGIPDGSVFMLPDVGHALSVLRHEDVEGDLTLLWLAPLILLSLVIL
jgi:hypothetical protein